jgi:hypothetical protein
MRRPSDRGSGCGGVTAWNLIAPNTLVAFPVPAGAPPMLQINLETPV